MPPTLELLRYKGNSSPHPSSLEIDRRFHSSGGTLKRSRRRGGVVQQMGFQFPVQTQAQRHSTHAAYTRICTQKNATPTTSTLSGWLSSCLEYARFPFEWCKNIWAPFALNTSTHWKSQLDLWKNMCAWETMVLVGGCQHCYRHFGSFSLFISTLLRSANGKFHFGRFSQQAVCVCECGFFENRLMYLKMIMEMNNKPNFNGCRFFFLLLFLHFFLLPFLSIFLLCAILFCSDEFFAAAAAFLFTFFV